MKQRFIYTGRLAKLNTEDRIGRHAVGVLPLSESPLVELYVPPCGGDAQLDLVHVRPNQDMPWSSDNHLAHGLREVLSIQWLRARQATSHRHGGVVAWMHPSCSRVNDAHFHFAVFLPCLRVDKVIVFVPTEVCSHVGGS